MSLKEELEQLRQRALHELKGLKDSSGLAELEVKYLGRKGELARGLKALQDVVAEERPRLGELANQVKREVEEAFATIKQKFGNGTPAPIDVTLPGIPPLRGHLHPVLAVQRELEELFRSMGFMVLDGPELESEFYNFEALNIPAWHPARDTQDTFYVKGGEPKNRWLLRTHTSPVQVRALQDYGAPIRAIVPGRVFRYEATDASHETTFWQMEGLVVDKDISVSHLIATMKALLTGIFKREVEVRLRPGYFPFVEPGFELDIKCLVCGGTGCSVCKHSGWVELLPCGLVHPKVLEYGGVNPKEYSGFAFGLGLSRLAMMRYKIDDIRLLLSGDLRFLEQF
ncbi:MAG: phenylalanine--tRNA ligase subunit alpha [Candidatus Veblenbacteria bacterium]|nr:phenylalanine--tRNA ligase subunit alpha [Candidatus Veblenbacteria bacterium]MDZ4229743.1 phenylalanine--tRNA ligase subunit alpha [Candidatus Veblenbacteria bacterium]